MKNINSDKIIKDLVIRVEKIKGSYVAFCAKFCIDYSWLCKFVNGKIRNPTIRSLEKLETSLDKWNGSES